MGIVFGRRAYARRARLVAPRRSFLGQHCIAAVGLLGRSPRHLAMFRQPAGDHRRVHLDIALFTLRSRLLARLAVLKLYPRRMHGAAVYATSACPAAPGVAGRVIVTVLRSPRSPRRRGDVTSTPRHRHPPPDARPSRERPGLRHHHRPARHTPRMFIFIFAAEVCVCYSTPVSSPAKHILFSLTIWFSGSGPRPPARHSSERHEPPRARTISSSRPSRCWIVAAPVQSLSPDFTEHRHQGCEL